MSRPTAARPAGRPSFLDEAVGCSLLAIVGTNARTIDRFHANGRTTAQESSLPRRSPLRCPAADHTIETSECASTEGRAHTHGRQPLRCPAPPHDVDTAGCEHTTD